MNASVPNVSVKVKESLTLVNFFPRGSAVFLKSPLMVRGESARKGAREVKKVTYMYEQHINRTYPKYSLTPPPCVRILTNALRVGTSPNHQWRLFGLAYARKFLFRALARMPYESLP